MNSHPPSFLGSLASAALLTFGCAFLAIAQDGESNSTSGKAVRRAKTRASARVADARAGERDAGSNSSDATNKETADKQTADASSGDKKPNSSPKTSKKKAPKNANRPLEDVPSVAGRSYAGKITKGTGELPNNAGQVWREYDLGPYVANVAGVENPQQGLIDWILRDTGSDVWFSAPLGILNADRDTLRVYHTPEMQEVVKGVYDRFLTRPGEKLGIGVRLVTVSSPNWRSRALSLMRPVETQSQGMEAWVLTKENASIVFGDLSRRADFREQASSKLPIANGQSASLARTKARQYMKSVRVGQDGVVTPETSQFEEGYSLEISPLLSREGEALDVAMKCRVDQVEKFVPVPVDVPLGGQSQRISVQVPQVVSWNVNERFRWPTDQVLVISCGVVATPNNDATPAGLTSFFSDTSRADAILFLEYLGPIEGAPAPRANTEAGLPRGVGDRLGSQPETPADRRPGGISRGRY